MIDELLMRLRLGHVYEDEAKAKLLELLESCKPEERPNAVKQGEIIPFDGDKKVEMHWLRKTQDAGFNQATQQYHFNIRKLFEVEG